jgi:O-antigen/teichoic acid export membrane protein
LTAQLISWLITLWVIRLLSPADYGLMAMAGVFVSMCGLLEEFGLGAMITRVPELDESTVRKTLAIVLSINAMLCGGLLAVAPAVAWFYAEPDVAPIVRLLALNFLVSAFVVIPRALMERALQFRKLATAELIVALTGALATFGLALHGYGVWSLVTGILATTLVRTVLLNVLCPFPRLPLWSVRGMREFLTFGGTLSLERIVWSLYSQADVLIASKLLGAHAAGFYVVGKQLASLPADKISPIIHQIVFPVFARMQGDPGWVSRGVLQGVNAVSVFAFPIAFGMAAVGGEAVPLILGPQWAAAALPMRGYVLIIPLVMIGVVILSALKAIGRPGLSLLNVALSSALMILAFLVGSRWELKGLSLAWVAAYPLYFLATVVWFLPALGTTARALVARIVQPFVASAIMLGLVAIAGAHVEQAVGDGPTRLALLVVIGVLVYGTAVATFARASFVEAVRFIRRKRPPVTAA